MSGQPTDPNAGWVAPAPAQPPGPLPPAVPGWSGAGAGASPAPPPMIMTGSNGPSMLVRAVWYVFIGWWLTGIVIAVGYFAALTIIGLPIAFYLFNRIPIFLTLRPRTTTYAVEQRGGMTWYRERHIDQRPMLERALWFVLVGWWLGAIWMSVAYGLCLILIGIPIGLMMFNRVGGVMTLLRY